MDFIKDQNPTALYEVGIKSGDKLPEYVKEASVLQEEDVKNLAPTAFADSVNRLFPVHTKAATYMSAVYLAGQGLHGSHVYNRVKQAAEYFDIQADIDYAISLLPSTTEKKASAKPAEYAITFQMDEDNWTAYPINTELELQKAALDIARDWKDDHIPTDWFYTGARNIVKKANALGISRDLLPASVWNMGEERLVDFEHAAHEAIYRASDNENKNNEYIKTVKEAADGKISVEEAIDKWMYLDAQNNFNHHLYGAPHQAFYSGPKVSDIEKFAADHVVIEDVMVPMESILELMSNEGKTIKRAFNKEAAEKVLTALSDATHSVYIGKEPHKVAAMVSARVKHLEVSQRKEILKLLLQSV